MDRAPWEVTAEPTTQPSPQRAFPSAPWETAPLTAAPPVAKLPDVPWEEAALSQPRSEGNTLFGSGKAETVIGEFGAGFQKGMRQLASTPYALAALGLEQFDYLTGFDNDELTRNLIQDAISISEGGAQRGIAGYEDLSVNPMTWLRFASGTLGESIPFVASIMAGGGAAGLLAKLMARKGIAASTRAQLLSTIPAQVTGAVATGTAIETGATAQELYQATNEVRPGASLLAGSAKGALEAVFPMMLARQLGLTGGQAVDLARRLFTVPGAKQVGKAIATEAGTEYLQEEVDLAARSYLDENFSFLSPEANSRRINALLAGGVGGGLIQTGAQLIAGRDPDGPAPEWDDIILAASDTPIVMGQASGELPVSDPSDILRTAPVGGPTTVTAATALEQQMLLAEDPIMKRGLYAPVVEGLEPQFGTQEEARNDAGTYGATGYLRLDPAVVRRGELTAAVQDLPATVADPRVEFTRQDTAVAAQTSLVEAIKLKGLAARARSGQRREELLQQAQAVYRQAIDGGVRVEPYSDGQVILRDPKRLEAVARQMENVTSQVSAAGLKEARTLPAGQKFYIFEQGAAEAKKGLGGRRLDLEKLNPDNVTGLPDANLARRVLGTHEVSRKLSLGRARGMGIRFTDKLSDPVKAQNALKLFVRFLQGMSTTTPFEKLPGPAAERFMKLVDLGLRLDVTPETGKFAVLDKLNEGVFAVPDDTVDPTVRMDADTARIVKSRSKRSREGRVSPDLQYENDLVAGVFFGQLHGTTIQKALAGDVHVKAAEVRTPDGPNREYVPERSPLAKMLRGVVKALGLQTDYVIEVVSPQTLPDRGVAYVEKTIALPNGKRSEPRSVIQINPWFYARPTLGDKSLVRPPSRWVIQGGPMMGFASFTQGAGLNRRVIYKGKEMSLGEVLKEVPAKGKKWPLLSFPDDVSKPGHFVGNLDPAEVEKRFPTAKPINDFFAPDAVAYQKYKDAPAPKYTFARVEDTNQFEGRVFYHGTKRGLSKLSQADVHGTASWQNLFGTGLYLTDNPEVAKSYSETKGIGPSGKVLAAKLKKVNLIDLEKPLPEDVKAVFRERLDEYLYAADIDAALDQPGRGVFDALREAMADTGDITTGDALEIFGDIAGALGNLGYDGFSHKGGQNVQTNNLGPHNVVVLFDNIGVKDGKEVGRGPSTLLEDVEYTPPASPPPVPAYKPDVSNIGAQAAKLGTGSTKLFVEDAQAAEFYADVAVAISESIVKFEWDRTPHAMQEAIQQTWRREMHLSQGTKAETQMAKVIPHPLLDRVLSGRTPRQSNQFGFEEWLVMQVARWMTGGDPNKRITPVEKFFQKVGKFIGKAIDALWKAAKTQVKPYSLDPTLGQPHEVVERWLAQLQLRSLDSIAGAESFLSEGTRNALLDSIRKNQDAFKALGIDEYVVAAPERASSRQVRELLKFFPKNDPEGRKKLEGLIAASDRYSTFLDWTLGIHQMAEMNPHIKPLKDYVSNTRAMENVALGWATMADGRLREAQKLGKAQLAALTGFMIDLDQMTYLDKEKLAKGEVAPRWPTAQELKTLIGKHKLSREAFDVYIEMRNDFSQFLSYLETVSVQQARDTISDVDELTAKVAEIQGQTAQFKSRPYFPHMRFGPFTLIVKGAKGSTLHFEAFPSKKARDEGAKQLEVRYANEMREGKVTIREDEMSEVIRQYQGLPGYALGNVKKALGLDVEDALLTPQQKKDRSMLEAMALAALPTESFRKHMANRANVPGFSQDTLRAYANYFGRSARFVARMEYGSKLEGSIREVRRTGSELTHDKRTRLADFMQNHFDSQMQPAADWADLRGLGFMWYFAFAPASALINLTQVPMVSIPYLASKFGDLSTMGKVTKAYADATKEFFGWLSGSRNVEDTIKEEALEEAHFSRLIDDGYAAELSALSQGPVLQATLGGTAVTRGLRRFAQWGTLPFQLAERMNRSVTFRAAYDLALRDNESAHVDEVMAANKPEVDQLRIDRGWDERHLRAYIAAADAVRKSQFEYGRWSRPKLMEGPRGVLLMFKSYLQNMLYFMFKSDRGTQVRFMLTLLAISGLMGMPGAEDAMELAKWLAKALGVRFDMEHTIRELMVGWGSGEYADIVLHGASREGFGVPAVMQGLGIPSPRIDLSGSLSMGRIIPGLKPLLNPGSSMNDAVGEVVSEIAGPVFGVPFDMYQAIIDQSLPAEDPKRWERALPRALKAASKASRYLAEERERDRTGATVMKWDPNDLNDQADILLGVGLGFQPTRLKQTWDYLRAQREVQDYWKGQRQVLMGELYRAHRLKDVEGKRDALDAVRRFNAEVPDRALKITGEALRQSMQARSRAGRMKEQGIPREKYLRGVTREVDRLYPEVVSRRQLSVDHKETSR